MISFVNNLESEPYQEFRRLYDKAISSEQRFVEAVSIASYCNERDFIDSRFVNLKIVDNEEFIFFSNYNSPKAEQFESHNQISANLFWDSVNVQIRMKATIKKKSPEFNRAYFNKRTVEKNILAISSNQSKKIDSYESILKKFDLAMKKSDTLVCPDYWGGFSFVPFSFEFWEGHAFRLNKRVVFEKHSNKWDKFILEP